MAFSIIHHYKPPHSILWGENMGQILRIIAEDLHHDRSFSEELMVPAGIPSHQATSPWRTRSWSYWGRSKQPTFYRCPCKLNHFFCQKGPCIYIYTHTLFIQNRDISSTDLPWSKVGWCIYIAVTMGLPLWDGWPYHSNITSLDHGTYPYIVKVHEYD